MLAIKPSLWYAQAASASLEKRTNEKLNDNVQLCERRALG